MGRILLCLVAILAIIGCGGEQRSVVGTWDVFGTPTQAWMEFKSDGTFVSVFGPETTTGPYKMDGDKFYMMGKPGTIEWRNVNEIILTNEDKTLVYSLRRRL